MNQEEIIKRLREPFPFEEVETKIQVTNADKTKGLAVFYLDARAVQERLDKIIGPFDWRNEYISWQQKAQICGLSLYNVERGEWITKYDGAENSDIEAVKGGLTDAFKRSAVLWGIGRYLYQIDGVWVEVEQRGKGSYIKDNQQGKLQSEYDKAVARIFSVAAPQTGASTGSSARKTSAQPVSQTTEKEKPHQSASQPEKNNLTPETASRDYMVKTVKPSGKSSQLLELIRGDGEVVKAYVKNSDQAIIAGSYLHKVVMERKQSSYGEYNLVNAYRIAA